MLFVGYRRMPDFKHCWCGRLLPREQKDTLGDNVVVQL